MVSTLSERLMMYNLWFCLMAPRACESLRGPARKTTFAPLERPTVAPSGGGTLVGADGLGLGVAAAVAGVATAAGGVAAGAGAVAPGAGVGAGVCIVHAALKAANKTKGSVRLTIMRKVTSQLKLVVQNQVAKCETANRD